MAKSPPNLMMPIVGFWGMFVTLIGLLISLRQWQKNRIETEFLKEQFKLVAKFLEFSQTNHNFGFSVSMHNGKVLMGGCAKFSSNNYDDLKNVNSHNYLVIHFPPESTDNNYFIEINEIIYNPLFPKELSAILSKMNTANYFRENDYGKNWFKDIYITADKQFVLMKGSSKEKLDYKPLRIPYKDDYLKVSDVLDIYDEFNRALKLWLSKHHIEINLNINN